MTIEMKKFGKILNGRPAGREAVLRVKQILNGAEGGIDELILDMGGIELLTPSFGDEFFMGLKDLYPDTKFKIQRLENNVVLEDTLKALDIV